MAKKSKPKKPVPQAGGDPAAGPDPKTSKRDPAAKPDPGTSKWDPGVPPDPSTSKWDPDVGPDPDAVMPPIADPVPKQQDSGR